MSAASNVIELNPRHVGIRTREWQEGERILFAFEYLRLRRDGEAIPEPLAVGQRIRMDGRPWAGPVFEGIVIDVSTTGDQWLLKQDVIGVRA